MKTFHEWHLVFNTKEDAISNNHPNAPYLAQYGANAHDLIKYLKTKEGIWPDSDGQIKEDDRMVNFWSVFFIVGIILSGAIGYAANSNVVGTTLGIVIILISLLGFYFTPKIRTNRRQLKLSKVRNDALDAYLYNLQTYIQDKYNNPQTNTETTLKSKTNEESFLKVVEKRPFTEEEKNAVVDAVVVKSQRGLSIQFNMKSGGVTFLPLSKKSTKQEGEKVDIRKAFVIIYSTDDGTQISEIEC